MADSVSLGTLKTKIREAGEIRDVYVSDARLTEWINDSIKDLYDRILTVNQDYFVTVTSGGSNISVVSGTESYALPSDFSHMLRVELLYQGTTDWRPLQQFNLSERSDWNWYTPTKLFYRYRVMDTKIYLAPIPTESATLRLWYVPVPPALSADIDTEDFIFGWDQFVILDCLKKHAIKEESDASTIIADRQDVLERILERAKVRDYGNPNTIRDTEREEFYARYPWIRVP